MKDRIQNDKNKLERELSDSTEDKNKLEGKLSDSTNNFENKLILAGVYAVVGWSLLAFKCVKDWFFGRSNSSEKKNHHEVKGTRKVSAFNNCY